MKRICLLLFVTVLFSCQLEKPQYKSARVFIRSGGTVESTYVLDADRTISQSSTREKGGAIVVRSYDYDARGQLRSIVRNGAPGTAKVTYYAGQEQPAAGGRSATTSRTIVDPDGGSEQSDIRYLYGPDGALIAVALTDARGNVQVKTLRDGGIKP
jgi:hypothetical protein